MSGLGGDGEGRLIPLYIRAYALWVGFSVVGFGLIPRLRNLLAGLAELTGLAYGLVDGIQRYGTLALGFFWLVFVIALEHFLRESVRRGQLWSLSLRLLLWMAGISALILGLEWRIA